MKKEGYQHFPPCFQQVFNEKIGFSRDLTEFSTFSVFKSVKICGLWKIILNITISEYQWTFLLKNM